MRAAEPHQRFLFGIRTFGSAADDALVDVEAVSYTHLDVYKRQA